MAQDVGGELGVGSGGRVWVGRWRLGVRMGWVLPGWVHGAGDCARMSLHVGGEVACKRGEVVG